MQQFGAFAFYTVVRRHKSCEVDFKSTSHNFIVLAISAPKIIKLSADLTKFWQKQVGSFFGTPCITDFHSICGRSGMWLKSQFVRHH